MLFEDSLIRSSSWKIFGKIGFYECRKSGYRECVLICQQKILIEKYHKAEFYFPCFKKNPLNFRSSKIVHHGANEINDAID